MPDSQYSTTQRVDAAWMIAVCIAVHGGEPPTDWNEDEKAFPLALGLAAHLAERYGRTNDPDSINRRLAGLGIKVEMGADDCVNTSTPNNGDPSQTLRCCLPPYPMPNTTSPAPSTTCVHIVPQKAPVAG
jgi:hypothetical protein